MLCSDHLLSSMFRFWLPQTLAYPQYIEGCIIHHSAYLDTKFNCVALKCYSCISTVAIWKYKLRQRNDVS